MLPPQPHPIRWTCEEYYRLSEANYFLERRVELLNGWIYVKPAQTEAHYAGVSLTQDALREAFGPDFWVRCRGSLDLSAFSVLDPDIAVVAGSVRSHKGNASPTSALLVVEVSDETTESYDLLNKTPVYAEAGVADYWIINLRDRKVEVYRVPAKLAGPAFGCSYSNRLILDSSDAIAPLAAPHAPIAVADLLP